MSIKIEVNLKELRCLDSSGDNWPEGETELEIRGGLGVSVGTTAFLLGNRESHTLFRKADGDGIEIFPYTGVGFHMLNLSKQLTVHPNEFV
ncbi:hypothetical protein QPL86_27475 (plasmid) [Bacillus bombysepticus]|nr:hypothetical protein QPL86_27475 [Bacillus bombysepticus]